MSDFSERINRALDARTDSRSLSEPDTSSDDSQSILSNVISSSKNEPDDISRRLESLLAARAQLSDDSDASEEGDDSGLLSGNPRIAALFGRKEGNMLNTNALLRALSEVASSPRHVHTTRSRVVSSDDDHSDSPPSIDDQSDGRHSRTEDEFVPDSPGVVLEGNGEGPDRNDPKYVAGKCRFYVYSQQNGQSVLFRKIAR
jgi:hypothetical protein